jgi:hypothetical protein
VTCPADGRTASKRPARAVAWGGDEVDAWAGHLAVSTPGIGSLGVGAAAEYNYATGDAAATDGVRGTFDQLFPTPHDKYGLSDQVGRRNIHHVGLGGRLRAWARVAVQANYHSWWLAEAADALYSAGGAPIARVPGGAAIQARGARARPAGVPRAHARHPDRRGIRARLPGRLSPRSDARRARQRAVRDGDRCLSGRMGVGGEKIEHLANRRIDFDSRNIDARDHDIADA